MANNCVIPGASLEKKKILGIPSFLLPWQPQVEYNRDEIDSLNPFLNPLKELSLLVYQVYLWNLMPLKDLEKSFD